MKIEIIHLDDQPLTVDWIPDAIFCEFAGADDDTPTRSEDSWTLRLAGQKELRYHLVQDKDAFYGKLSASECNNKIFILDYHFDGNNLALGDIQQQMIGRTIVWTAYPGEARSSLKPLVDDRAIQVVQKGARLSLLQSIGEIIGIGRRA